MLSVQVRLERSGLALGQLQALPLRLEGVWALPLRLEGAWALPLRLEGVWALPLRLEGAWALPLQPGEEAEITPHEEEVSPEVLEWTPWQKVLA